MTLLKTLLFTVLVPGTVIIYVPFWLLTSHGGAVHLEATSLWILGIIPFLLGVCLYLWCAWHFTFAGQGTPAPIDPPKHLVARGPYQMVRNPMYVGVVTALLGEALLFHELGLVFYAALVLLIVHLFVVFVEEPLLRQKFGASYQDYCAQVPRWIPHLSIRWRRSSAAG
jgi:protein-S-isoprenylcysteine O-methyltransferase Ste14